MHLDDSKRGEQIIHTLTEQAIACDRGIVAMRADGEAGIALVAPDSLMMAVAWFGGAMITDHHLN
jgi:hypothetical protein